MVVEQVDYTLIVGELRTGIIGARLPFAGIKWGQRLNNHGPVSATLRPYSRQLARYDLRNLTLPGKQFIGIDYRGTILEAGPIWTRDFDEDTGDLQLDGLGLWSIFDHRKTIPGFELDPQDQFSKPALAKLDIYRAHLGSIGRELVRVSLEDNPYAAGGLPIVLPADQPGNAHERHYKGYNLGWIADDLKELTEAAGGPDMRFRPRYVTGQPNRIEWAFEHGKVDLLQQDGPAWEWDVKVEKSGVTKLGVTQDATKLANHVWTPGSGQEEEMRMTIGQDLTLLNAGFPWLEGEKGSKDTEDLALLQSYSDRHIADVAMPWETWRPVVRADTNPVLGAYSPGDWGVLNMPDNHPILPPLGKVRVRILAVDGDHTNNVKLAVAPIQGRV